MEITTRQALAAARLYGILDLGYVPVGNAGAMAEQMIAGGVQILQIRAKGQPVAAVKSVADAVRERCRHAGVPLILNDYPALVGETGSTGTHVGQDDLSVAAARELAGPGAMVGKSTHSLDQAEAGAREGADYIGFGPLFATPTKPDYTPIGIHEIQEAHRRVTIPIFCIGGIKLENLGAVIQAGARRVVIVSGILQTPNVAAYCRACREILDSTPLA